jgi:hypothetical protein
MSRSFYNSFSLDEAGETTPHFGSGEAKGEGAAQAKEGEGGGGENDLSAVIASLRFELDGEDEAMPKADAKDTRDDHKSEGAQAKAGGGLRGEFKSEAKIGSNSTGTLYVNSTLQMPDNDHLLRSISMLLDQMIVRSCSDYDMFTQAQAPSLDECDVQDIFSFIKKAFSVAMWSPEVNVIAMVLISRLQGSKSMSLNLNNWDKVILCAMLVAQKIWDDVPLANVDFPTLWNTAFHGAEEGKLNLQDINRMEKLFLELLHYDVHVTRATYTQFYFELHSLQSSATVDQPMIPQLSEDNAQALEARSSTFSTQLLSYSDKKAAMKASSKSLNVGPGHSLLDEKSKAFFLS